MRRFYVDEETERLFSDDSGVEPDGALVEEISAREYFLRAGHHLSCGWPKRHHDADESICPCGLIFPARAPEDSHKAPTRYFYHPESGSLFTTNGEDPPTDGLVEEVSQEDYERIETEQQEYDALS